MRQSGSAAVVMVIQNDEETVERAIKPVYDCVKHLFVSIDPDRGWTGISITPDRTLEIIKSIDRESKVEIIARDFCGDAGPMANETAQRQYTTDYAADRVPGLKWIVQIDADEQFLDFPFFLKYLHGLPSFAQVVYWVLIPIFNILDDGKLLVVTDYAGAPLLEVFPVAHRPHAKLERARHIAIDPKRTLRQKIVGKLTGHRPGPRFDYPADLGPSKAVLHFTFARSEPRVLEKLSTWGHAQDIDADSFFELWKRSKTEWEKMKDFHPLVGTIWPALRPFTYDQLIERSVGR